MSSITTSDDQMTFAEYKNVVNDLLVVNGLIQSDIDHGIISDTQGKFLLDVAILIRTNTKFRHACINFKNACNNLTKVCKTSSDFMTPNNMLLLMLML